MKDNTAKLHLLLSFGEPERIKFGNSEIGNHIGTWHFIQCKTRRPFCKNSMLI